MTNGPFADTTSSFEDTSTGHRILFMQFCIANRDLTRNWWFLMIVAAELNTEK